MWGMNVSLLSKITPKNLIPLLLVFFVHLNRGWVEALHFSF